MALPAIASLALLLAVARAPEDAPKVDKTAPRPVPTSAVTLDAIDRILADPKVDAMRSEYPLIVDFAQRSDQVEIVIGEPFFAFSGQKPLDAALLAYYLAGAVKFDLTHRELVSDPRADVPDAIRAALVFYRKYHAAHPETSHPLFERFDKLDREGGLEAFVRDAQTPPASPR
jgi:hypothetical protein